MKQGWILGRAMRGVGANVKIVLYSQFGDSRDVEMLEEWQWCT